MASKSIVKYRNRFVGKARRVSRSKRRIPLAVIAGFAPLTMNFIADAKSHGITDAAQAASFNLTGYGSIPWQGGAPRFSLSQMKYGGMPILAGFGVHWIASKIGLNRAIAKSGIPFISI
jgi:hypothetical protein